MQGFFGRAAQLDIPASSYGIPKSELLSGCAGLPSEQSVASLLEWLGPAGCISEHLAYPHYRAPPGYDRAMDPCTSHLGSSPEGHKGEPSVSSLSRSRSAASSARDRCSDRALGDSSWSDLRHSPSRRGRSDQATGRHSTSDGLLSLQPWEAEARICSAQETGRFRRSRSAGYMLEELVQRHQRRVYSGREGALQSARANWPRS